MDPDLSLSVSELFYSIQGESTLAGFPCVFIRLTGCNLRCAYCDAAYAYEETGRTFTLQEIWAYTDQYPAALVEITGGEPLLQENVYPLMDSLIQRGRTVLLETNGSIPLHRVPADVIKIMDIKCPGSGMHDRMDFSSLTSLRTSDNVKFVLSSRDDFDWAVQCLHQHFPGLKQGADFPRLLFSAVEGKLAHALLAEWILEEQLPVQLQLQLHKILWPGQNRGV